MVQCFPQQKSKGKNVWSCGWQDAMDISIDWRNQKLWCLVVMQSKHATVCCRIWKTVFCAAFNWCIFENHRRGSIVEILLRELIIFFSNCGFSWNSFGQTSMFIGDVLRMVNVSDGCARNNLSCQLKRRELCGKRVFTDQHSVTADVWVNKAALVKILCGTCDLYHNRDCLLNREVLVLKIMNVWVKTKVKWESEHSQFCGGSGSTCSRTALSQETSHAGRCRSSIPSRLLYSDVLFGWNEVFTINLNYYTLWRATKLKKQLFWTKRVGKARPATKFYDLWTYDKMSNSRLLAELARLLRL